MNRLDYYTLVRLNRALTRFNETIRLTPHRSSRESGTLFSSDASAPISAFFSRAMDGSAVVEVSVVYDTGIDPDRYAELVKIVPDVYQTIVDVMQTATPDPGLDMDDIRPTKIEPVEMIDPATILVRVEFSGAFDLVANVEVHVPTVVSPYFRCSRGVTGRYRKADDPLWSHLHHVYLPAYVGLEERITEAAESYYVELFGEE